jgi:DNA repair ATPase RecN
MDAARRAAVYDLLAEISRRRQIFLLTCQEWIAAEAEHALKLERVTLPG